MARGRVLLQDIRPDASFVEMIDDEQFPSHPMTPYLARALDGVVEALRQAFHGVSPDVEVCSQVPLVVGASSIVVPDLVVRVAGERAPQMVIELRTESTERYALGPKRLTYQRAGIPEFWFIEPRHHRVRTMWLGPGKHDYVWPPKDHGTGDVLHSRQFPAVEIAVDELFEGVRAS